MTAGHACRRRGDTGMAVLWQVVIVIAVMAILAGIAGPSIGGLLGRATGTALTASVSSAAASLREVYEEGIAADEVNPDGSPKPGLLARIGAAESAEGLDWRAVWAFDDEDDSNIVRVQFLKTMQQQPRRGVAGGPTGCTPFLAAAAQTYHGACGGNNHPPGPVPPTVSWLGSDYLAARVHARADSGEWACALVIHAPDTHTLSIEGAKQTSGTDKGPLLLVHNGRARPAGTAGALTWQEAHDRLKRSGGVWYDSGGETVEDGLFDCSPVLMITNGVRNGRSPYPPAEGVWEIRQARAGWWTGPEVEGTLTPTP